MTTNNDNQLDMLQKINNAYHLLTNPIEKNALGKIKSITILLLVGIISFNLLSKSALIGQILLLPEEAYFKIYSLLICISFLAIFSPFLIFNNLYRNMAFIIIIGIGTFFSGYSEKIIKVNPEAYMDYGSEISHVSRKRVI